MKDNNTQPISAKTQQAWAHKYGWLSPEGRLYHCHESKHAEKAKHIVDKTKNVTDPEIYLENLGWAKIHQGVAKQYAVGMGNDKKLTDAQIRKLQELHLDTAEFIDIYL